MWVCSKENALKRIQDLKGWEMKENTSKRSREFSESLLPWLICLVDECSQSSCLLVHSTNPNALLADKHQIRCLHWLTKESLKSRILKWGGDAILARRLSFGAASPERITILVSKPTEQGPISERTLDISILKKAVGLVMVKTDQSVTDYRD